MKRKQEDIYISIELIAGGYYRSAVRNLFALLDSEYKKAAIAWEKVNNYYAKVVSSIPVEGVLHRNSIVHGDYESDLMDVDRYSTTKMMLLFLNLRIICNKAEIFENLLLYLPSTRIV